MMDRFVATWLAARRAGAPLVSISTPDPAALQDQLLQPRGEKGEGPAVIGAGIPVITWDVGRGPRALNKPGQPALKAALGTDSEGNPRDPSAFLNGTELLAEVAPKLPEKTVLFMVNVHRYLQDGTAAGAAFVQSIWNLRDAFKGNLRTLVLLGPDLQLPPELNNDVLQLDEPLPSEQELRRVVVSMVEENNLQVDEAVRERAVDALRGLASFPAEQATAMAVKDGTLDPEVLWQRKVKMIGATPGLSVWRGGEVLDDIGGNEQVKRYLRLLKAGKRRPRAVVWLDEIDRMIAGATGIGDSSGVSQGQLQVLLTALQDFIKRGSTGMLFLGPGGAGKSAVAKAAGAEMEVLTVAMDIGGMKASLVGQSEQMIRGAVKVLEAVSDGRMLFIGTCNAITTIPVPLRRRFTGGTFFFDLPDDGEKLAIWRIKMKAFGLAEQELPYDAGWTGAEIEQACTLADNFGIPLVETPQFIVPVAKSGAEDLANLRKQAAGRYLSAAHAGLYQLAAPPATEDVPTARPRRRTAAANQEV